MVFTLIGMMSLSSLTVYAQATNQESNVAITQLDAPVSIHQIKYATPISLAELMFVIVKSTGQEVYPIMDAHYATSAMLEAQKLGIITLDDYPESTWLEPLTEEEFNLLLTKAMQSGKVDMGKVYEAVSASMIQEVKVDGNVIDLAGQKIRHYRGNVMVPLRVVAEEMGFKITWDKETYTATLSNGEIKSPVQVGYDNYFYSSEIAIGMSAPMSVGVAPQLVDGQMYVPYQYFELFSTVEIGNNTITYTMK